MYALIQCSGFNLATLLYGFVHEGTLRINPTDQHLLTDSTCHEKFVVIPMVHLHACTCTTYVAFITVTNMIIFSTGGFAELPTNQEVSVGDQAVFRCQHLVLPRIDWWFNGSLIDHSNTDINPNTTRGSGGTVVSTLTITARLEYDGFRIQCEAFSSSSATHLKSPEVFLTGNQVCVPLDHSCNK